jgi:hypothetical protein
VGIFARRTGGRQPFKNLQPVDFSDLLRLA